MFRVEVWGSGCRVLVLGLSLGPAFFFVVEAGLRDETSDDRMQMIVPDNHVAGLW